MTVPVDRRSSPPLYTDERFPPDDRALYGDPRAVVTPTMEMRSLKNYFKEFYELDVEVNQIVWLRPHGICERMGWEPPQFVIDGYTLHDINQGHIGDCWFAAQVSHITRREDLLMKVVPQGQNFGDGYTGKFHFRFWNYRYEFWKDVEVDDYLPCETKNGQLVSVLGMANSNQHNEFWVPLIEKAYAKLHGSYEGINGAYLETSPVDSTGSIVNSVSINAFDTPGDLFDHLLREQREGKLMTISTGPITEEEHAQLGLVKYHAYTLLDVREVKDTSGVSHRLLRVRNPYGSKPNHGMDVEWKGAWSDSSPEWNLLDDVLVQEMLTVNSRDGEFWISLEDALEYYFSSAAVRLFIRNGLYRFLLKLNYQVFKTFPFRIERGVWVKSQYETKLEHGVSDYVLEYPQYLLQVDDFTKIIIWVVESNSFDRALMQNKNHAELQAVMGVHVFELNGPTVNRVTDYKNLKPILQAFQDVDIRSWEWDFNFETSLNPGAYLVIPSATCTNCTLDSLKFSIRVLMQSEGSFLSLQEDPTDSVNPYIFRYQTHFGQR